MTSMLGHLMSATLSMLSVALVPSLLEYHILTYFTQIHFNSAIKHEQEVKLSLSEAPLLGLLINHCKYLNIDTDALIATCSYF